MTSESEMGLRDKLAMIKKVKKVFSGADVEELFVVAFTKELGREKDEEKAILEIKKCVFKMLEQAIMDRLDVILYKHATAQDFVDVHGKGAAVVFEGMDPERKRSFGYRNNAKCLSVWLDDLMCFIE